MQKKALLIFCFDWYEKRLKYIGKYLEEKGYRVDYISSDFDHIKKSYTDEFEHIEHFHYITVPSYNKNISIKRIGSHKVFSVKICRIIKKSEPDLVYCLLPPNCLAKDITILKKRMRFKLIYDVIDLWPESFPKGNTNVFPYNMWRNLRDKYIVYADKIVLECAYYKSIIKKIVPSYKINIIPIVKEKIENVEQIDYTEDICLGYLGSINSLIDIDKISEIVQILAKENTVLVRIIGDGENKDIFIKKLKKAGAHVEFYGKIFNDIEKKRILGACDFGLNIYKNNISIGLTLKSVDYFQLGLPILNTIFGDTYELVKKYHVGVNVADLCASDIINEWGNIKILKKNVSIMFENEFTPCAINKKIEKVFLFK